MVVRRINVSKDTIARRLGLCGLKEEGCKNQGWNRLQAALQRHTSLPPTARLLSIDIGPRSLAYALLTPGPPADIKLPIPETISATVHAWSRLALRPVSDVTDNHDGRATDVATEDFTAAPLAQMAYNLVHDHFLALKPTHILVERQSFRGSGRLSVPESILRVHMLEAMIYSTFTTLKHTTGYDTAITPIPPRRAANFIVDNWRNHANPSMAQRKEAAAVRQAERGIQTSKVNLLAEMIEEGQALYWAPRTQRLVNTFIRSRRVDRKLSKKDERSKEMQRKIKGVIADSTQGETGVRDEIKEDGEYLLTQLDDLADCVLQGLTYMHWQKNLDNIFLSQPQLIDAATKVLRLKLGYTDPGTEPALEHSSVAEDGAGADGAPAPSHLRDSVSEPSDLDEAPQVLSDFFAGVPPTGPEQPVKDADASFGVPGDEPVDDGLSWTNEKVASMGQEAFEDSLSQKRAQKIEHNRKNAERTRLMNGVIAKHRSPPSQKQVTPKDSERSPPATNSQ